MNGARRIRSACKAWYFVSLGLSFPVVYILAYGVSMVRVPNVIDISEPLLWVGLSALGALPFVCLIHLLACIWETLIGMASAQAPTVKRSE